MAVVCTGPCGYGKLIRFIEFHRIAHIGDRPTIPDGFAASRREVERNLSCFNGRGDLMYITQAKPKMLTETLQSEIISCY